MIASEDTDKEGEAVSRCLKEDLNHSFEVVLKDLPEVLLYINRLNEHIKKQQYTLVKLFEKLKEYKQSSCHTLKNGCEMIDACTQTDTLTEGLAPLKRLQNELKGDDRSVEWTSATQVDSGISLADEVKKVAESAMQQTGFVYEETSGMYYDYNTGYYYNAEMGLYYDGHSGTYLYYNEGTKLYEYHSQAALPAPVITPEEVKTTSAPSLSIPMMAALASISTAIDVKQNCKKSSPDPSTAEVVKKKSTKSSSEPSTSAIKLKRKSSRSSLDSSTLKKVKKKSKKSKKPTPDPLEAKEIELQMTAANPMAPVLSESSNVSSPRESEHDQRSPNESRHGHKRKTKHKKHKSKKRKKKRHRSRSRSENSLEEGECSVSSESECDNEIDKSVKADAKDDNVTNDEILGALDSNPWKKQRRLSDEASEAWPPCMRIIVQSTEVKNLNVGTLFIVTCKGGTMGREKSHAVSIPDINISKHHGIFTFDEKNGQYYFTDYGSRNGTYVNKQRLSVAKQESEPCEIPHGTIITFGSTDLLCHIHPGRETCEECEPGVVAAKIVEDYEPIRPIHSSSTNTRKSKSENRLQELRRLRKRFGLESNESKGELAPGYEDRAEIRRVTVGSHNEHAKTESASTTESIRSTNKGFKMLSKMGWKEGESLGRDGTGLTEPVLVAQRADKAGLGAENAFSPSVVDNRTKHRADKWQRARQRYVQLPDTVDGHQDQDGGDGDDD